MSCVETNILPLCIIQNQSFELPLFLLMDDGITPINITSWSFTGSIKQSYEDAEPILFFTSSVWDDTSGSVRLRLSGADTWRLNQKKYVYDVVANNPTVYPMESTRIIQGTIMVELGVTAQ